MGASLFQALQCHPKGSQVLSIGLQNTGKVLFNLHNKGLFNTENGLFGFMVQSRHEHEWLIFKRQFPA